MIIILCLLGFFSNLLNNIQLSLAFETLAFPPLVFIFFIIFLFFYTREIIDSLVFSANIFCVVVLILNFLLLTGIFISPPQLLEKLTEFDGFFYKYGDLNFYVVYFQSTLALGMFSLIAYYNGYYKSYFFILFILVISLARFGIFVAILFPILSYFFSIKSISYCIKRYFLPFSLIIIIIYYLYALNYKNTGDFNIFAYRTSFDARIAHMISVFDSFDYTTFFWGQGLGSSFFSIRSYSYVNNIELSQLEILRKFGFIGYGLLNIIIYLILKLNNENKQYRLNIFVFSIYLLAMSNPILTSIIMSIILGLSLKENNNGNQNER